ncbi:tetratricopeptide repeat protein [Roseomonas eburnea]|uniref:Tetratricopeptide repeat protein 38 n=1 Tax=Neoroseomonas eburnea TaxID=1346889 RepID=A0A9X9XGY1_9PROT|nr:tetratricopeptide repeat protein [Neoroseomonas eburnea]MBR0682967.1 tetratricopeptide repeat protein [Neoroseomonas eburnea]
MIITDGMGNALSGASAAARDIYAQALAEFRIYSGDPVATAQRAVEDSPGFVMGHALLAWLCLLGTEPAGIPVAREAIAAARRLPMTEQERGHVAALSHLVEGDWWAASRTMEDVAIAHPRDMLALQCGHQIDFFTGHARMLRDRIARALPAWNAGMPGYHAMLSMHAFGLEEMGDYAAAERAGRRAVEMEPRDGWGQHAVAHVLEMQNRVEDGITWMRANPDAWSRDSFFAVHNWWHLALYHLERGEIAEVLALYDGPVRGGQSSIVLDLVDATAMLWRLHLRGLDVGNRWQAVADQWETVGGAGSYAFNDWHAAMAFLRADRPGPLEALIEAATRAASGAGDNAMFTRDVGLPLIRGVKAFAEDDHAMATRRLRAVRNIAHRFGGSHAQRDLIDLTLIEAALRGGDAALSEALVAERAAIRPHSPVVLDFTRRLAA